MNSVTQSSVPLNSEIDYYCQGNYQEAVEWAGTIAAPDSPHFLAIAIVVQQKFEPSILMKKGSQMVEGEVLPEDEGELLPKDLGHELKMLPPPEILDPAFLPIVNSEVPRRPMCITRTEERLDNMNSVLFSVYRNDTDKPILKLLYGRVIQEAFKITHNPNTKDVLKSSFNVLTRVLFSSTPPYFPVSLLEKSFLGLTPNDVQDIASNFKQSEFCLEPRAVKLLGGCFDHGKIEKTVTKLSFVLEGTKITTNQEKTTSTTKFIDVRHRIQASFII